MALLKCPECATEIPEGASTCPNCGCPLETYANETVLREGFATFTNASWANVLAAAMSSGRTARSRRRAETARRNLGMNGHGVLTDTRFVFGKGKDLKKMPVGSSVNFEESIAKGDIAFDIPLADISTVTKGRQGFSTLFVIETSDGDVYKFAVMKKSAYEAWQAAFDNALGKA